MNERKNFTVTLLDLHCPLDTNGPQLNILQLELFYKWEGNRIEVHMHRLFYTIGSKEAFGISLALFGMCAQVSGYMVLILFSLLVLTLVRCET